MASITYWSTAFVSPSSYDSYIAAIPSFDAEQEQKTNKFRLHFVRKNMVILVLVVLDSATRAVRRLALGASRVGVVRLAVVKVAA